MLAADPSEYTGDAAANLKRIVELGIHPVFEVPAKLRERREVNVVVDALLGTGLTGPPTGRTAELIASTREFPQARIVAVDLPSGLGGGGDCVRADITVTFTAPKVEHYLAPGAEEHVGRLVVSQIGSPPWLIPGGSKFQVPGDFRHLFRPRKREAHKGDFGHVLVVGGAPGKSGAAAMAGTGSVARGCRVGHGRVFRFFPASTGVDVGFARQLFAGTHHGAGGRSWLGRSARDRLEAD